MTKAMVMAAGLGKRMQPLTLKLPKPLIPVAGVTLIDRTLDWLAAAGISECVVNAHYLAPLLTNHLAGRKSPAIHISYEPELLETGGGIKQALPFLGSEPFFAANSDVICIDGPVSSLQAMQAHWNDEVMDALLLIHPTEKAIGFSGPGDFFLEADGRVRRRGSNSAAPYVFTGTQLLHPRLFEGTPGGAFSMNLLYDRTLERGRLYALVHQGDWLHVGDPAGLAEAEAFLK